MMKRLLYVILLFALVGCRQEGTKQADAKKDQLCARTEPEAVLFGDELQNHQFAVKGFAATESAQLPHETHITVHHKGCDSYILQYQFQLNTLSVSSQNHHYWYTLAIQELEQLQHFDRSPFNFAKAIEQVRSYTSTSDSLQFQQKLYLNTEEMPEWIILDSVSSQEPIALYIELGIGPIGS